MKQKKISKKLVLNKETISSLNHHEMSLQKGGQSGECTAFLVCLTTLRQKNCDTKTCPTGPQG